ncbi:hypothetical protein [Polyangium jinanense]|uniref:Uncharacterized protein n=1 Tax=Polyangium jinanense TaxID=2829994 RepID=A0A9X4AR40_9BACT|nr:hypothetical protein [Polyangium jinanense]MDC3953177.1 hypothetical protein [Polyangium jinanense]MDC3979702.1 hypothetical protein [Polyangium jinanense]
MQSPTRDTPVSKCSELARYSARMLGKFSANAVLVGLAEKMTCGEAELIAAQVVYEEAVKAILPARVDVKYENHVSDRRVRISLQKAEIADGRSGGRIAGMVFPEGSGVITRLLGESQVQAMIDLEGRLAAAAPFWPEAEAERLVIAAHRQQYQVALASRKVAAQKARDARAARDAAKEKFLLVYTEVMSRLVAEFPRDRVTQDLFFDEVRTRSALAAADTGAGDEALETDPAQG